jgi:hypothetical protein
LEAPSPYVGKCGGARGAANRLRRKHLGFSYIDGGGPAEFQEKTCGGFAGFWPDFHPL